MLKRNLSTISIGILVIILLSILFSIIGYKTFCTLNQTVDWNALTAIVAVFIGICALGVSFWQGVETRKNNILLVTPFITILGDWRDDAEYPGITFQNKGIGPAIIKEVEITYLKRKYNFFLEGKEFMTALSQGLRQAAIAKCHYHSFDSGEYIAVGEIVPVICLSKSSAPKIGTFKELLSGMKITLNYASIYGDSYSAYYNAD